MKNDVLRSTIHGRIWSYLLIFPSHVYFATIIFIVHNYLIDFVLFAKNIHDLRRRFYISIPCLWNSLQKEIERKEDDTDGVKKEITRHKWKVIERNWCSSYIWLSIFWLSKIVDSLTITCCSQPAFQFPARIIFRVC